MEKIKFIDNADLFKMENAFVAHLGKIASEEELFNQLSNRLKFPNYFGFNWDALSDLLTDFHWIQEKQIILVHDEIPNLDQYTFKMYLEILYESTEDWKEGEEHDFQVIFPFNAKSVIQRTMD